ncbi:O-Antigen ligase [compost metagenome]
MSARVVAEATPAWLWPWCLFLFLLPFDGFLASRGLGFVMTLLSLGAALLLALAPRSGVRGASGRSVAVVLFLLACAASSFASLNPAATQAALFLGALHGLLYLLATAAPLSLPQLRTSLRAWMWGGGVAAFCIVLAFLQGRLFTDGARETLYLWGGQTDPNFFSAHLIFPFSLALMALKERGRRLEGGAILALCATAVMITQSRGGAIALVAIVVLSLVFARRWKTLAALVALAGGLLTVMATSLGRFNLQEDPSGSGRTDLWRVGIEAGFAHWPTGVGLDAFKTVAGAASGLYWYMEIHNTYLEAFVEAGLPGLITFLLILFTHFRFPRSNPLVSPIRLALIGLLLDAVFLHFLGFKVFWVGLAMAAQVALTGEEPQSAPPSPHPRLSLTTR